MANTYDIRVIHPGGKLDSLLAVARSHGSAWGDFLDLVDTYREHSDLITVELLRNGDVIATATAGRGGLEVRKM